MAETNIKVLKIEVDTGTGAIKVNGVTKSIKEATAATKEFVTSAGKMEDATVGFNNAAGLAGATVNEFGRLISDMPFGLTAVTNNISQLGSLFSVLVGKASQINNGLGTLKNTIALLKKELMGPLGILLLFQSAVASLEVWAQNAKKADKTTSDLNKSVGEAATELKIAREMLNDTNVSLEKKESILGQVNSKYKDLKLSLDENGIATAESTSRLNEQIIALDKLAKSQAIVNEVQRIYGEMAVLNAKTGAAVATGLDTFLTGLETAGEALLFFGSFGFAGEQADFYGKKIEERGQFTKKKLLDENKKIVKDLLTQLEVLFSAGNKTPGIKKLEDLNSLLIKSQIEYLQSVNELTEEAQLQNLNGITGLKLEELDIQKKSSLDKAKEEKRSNKELLLIEEAYENKRIALINNSNEKALSIRKSFNKELKIDAETYTDDKHLDAMLETLLPAKEQVENRAKEITDGLAAYQKRREDAERNGNEAVQKLRIDNINKAAAALDTIANLAESAAGIMDAEFQKQMDLEQNKTTALNNQLRERLANEQLSANERKNIQSQISANDEALRIKQEAIAKKRFKTEKALRISVAIIDTASSALKAYASQLSVPTPDAPFRAAAAAAVATALGLAQVAMISKQQFLGSASASPAGLGGAAGGGGGVQAPDFNIVGQSASNQIAAAVQGQFQQPIKAYVVSKDVSTAQEMDRNIIGSASLG
jgi:predicted pyridoxine 5'-phosphate oxidase superfamily flavin-nucleotide-binding protein